MFHDSYHLKKGAAYFTEILLPQFYNKKRLNEQILKWSLQTVLIVFTLLVLLDFGYTKIYEQSDSRGKIDKVYNSAPISYDVVILGSSQ
jgi:hypothetical protein